MITIKDLKTMTMERVLKYLIALQNMLSKSKIQYDFYEWLIRNGKIFHESDGDRKRENELIKDGFPHEVRNCFYNSQMIALAKEQYPLCEYYEGWAYHRGRYISYSCSNEGETGLCKEPLFFFIDDDFINMFNRNKAYPPRSIGKKTNGLYASIIKLVPREDIIAFLNGQEKKPISLNQTTLNI